MDLEVGYLAICDRRWINYCRDNQLLQVNYWIRRQAFKVVQIGSPIFLMEKGTRKVFGFGAFKQFEISTVLHSWTKYGVVNGASSREEFMRILGLNGEEETQRPLGNILIDNVKWTEHPVSIDSTEIEFSKSTVSGKRIYGKDVAYLRNLIIG